MKKEDIKADPIKERIVSFVNFIVLNSKIVWMSIVSIIVLIVFITYYASAQKSKYLEQNLALGILQNKSIHSGNQNDSLFKEYENILSSYSESESYNQAYIYMVSHYINSNNNEMLEKLLFAKKFNSIDNMQNSFIFKVKGDFYSNNGDIDKAASNYKNAYDTVPNYDLKILYCSELINLYLNSNNYKSALNELDKLRIQIGDYEKLSFSSKNNFDYIESKLLHLVK